MSPQSYEASSGKDIITAKISLAEVRCGKPFAAYVPSWRRRKKTKKRFFLRSSIFFLLLFEVERGDSRRINEWELLNGWKEGGREA